MLGSFLFQASPPVAKSEMHYYFMGGISVYTALLLLLTLRVHYSFDNPYLHILTVMFGTRTFMKASDLSIKFDFQSLLILLDTACFCTLLAIGVGLSADDVFDSVQHQLTILVISLLLSTTIVMNRPA